MNGRRVQDHPTGEGIGYQPGDYARIDGVWYGCTPNGLIANLRNHAIIEHEDGTITAAPSIEVKGRGYWHGYLERGAWREC